MKITIKYFVVFFSVFLFSDSYSQRECKNDVTVIFSSKEMNEVGFQPVQAVWVDDSIYGSNYYQISNDPIIYDCSELPMILGKPTLLSGLTHSTNFVGGREVISFDVKNSFTSNVIVYVKFSIVEDNQTIFMKGPYILPAATAHDPCNFATYSTITIAAPVPDEPFYFHGTGTKTIKMELIVPPNDVYPNNNVCYVKCNVVESRYLPIVVAPLLFKDRLFKYPSGYFSQSGAWFNEIKESMKFVYDVLPVPEHDVDKYVYNPSVGMFAHTKYNSDWINLSEDEQDRENGKDFMSISRETKFFDANQKLLVMVDEDFDFQNGIKRGYLSNKLEATGMAAPSATTNIAFIQWSDLETRESDQVIAHELTHLFGLWWDPEEYADENTLGRYPAYGYRVSTREYKDNTQANPHYCYMGTDLTDNGQAWVHKDDYVALAWILSDPAFTDPEIVNVSGTIDRSQSNLVTLNPSYKFFSNNIDLDSGISFGKFNVNLKNSSNQIIKQVGFSPGFRILSENGDTADDNTDLAIFNYNFTATSNTKKIEVRDTFNVLLAQRIITTNTPTLSIQYPMSGQIFNTDSVYIGWNSGDADGDTLYHAIFYSVKNHEFPTTIWIPVDIDVKGNHYDWTSVFQPDNKYRIKIYSSDGYNTKADSSDYFTVGTPSSITVIPEGFYNNISNSLNSRDTVTIYLRNIVTPYSIVDSSKLYLDSLTFNGTVFFPAASTGTYYIVVKHRNSIETWSKSGGESYVEGYTFSYDFTTSSSKAFGDNMKQVDTSPVRFAIHSGDVNQDGVIDVTDMLTVYNDLNNAVSGYVSTDVNGDRELDVSDIITVYNNAINIVEVITP